MNLDKLLTCRPSDQDQAQPLVYFLNSFSLCLVMGGHHLLPLCSVIMLREKQDVYAGIIFMEGNLSGLMFLAKNSKKL